MIDQGLVRTEAIRYALYECFLLNVIASKLFADIRQRTNHYLDKVTYLRVVYMLFYDFTQRFLHVLYG